MGTLFPKIRLRYVQYVVGKFFDLLIGGFAGRRVGYTAQRLLFFKKLGEK